MRKVFFGVMLAGVSAVGLAGPAFAASSFTWNGYFEHRLDSRNYDPTGTGYHDITKRTADCPGPGDLMQVRLVENRFFGDYNYAWKNWNCTEENQTRSWYAGDDGDHHFSVEKADTDSTAYNWYAAGITTFP